jgi:anti-sigma factor RsiW
MIGHLGSRVSALLDGQLSPDEEERAWAHVHTCHQCRDLVEREGWVKTRLAGLSFEETRVPGHLKGSLLGALATARPPGDVILEANANADARPRWAALSALGGGAGAAAVMGVLALGAAPADAPTFDRRLPATSVSTPSPAHLGGPARRAVGP